MRGRHVALALASALGLGGLGSLELACGDFSPGADGGPSLATPDAGVASDGGPNGGAAVGPLVAIHASYNLPAFRLCLPGKSGAPPAPAAGNMSQSNVVGVDVGSAARLDAVAAGDAGGGDAGGVDAGGLDAGPSTDAGPADAGKPDGAAADAGKTDAGPPPVSVGKVHVIPETLLRFRTGSCDAILPTLAAGSFYSLDLVAFGGAALGDTSTRLVIVEGCAPGVDPAAALLACGDGYDPVAGNLRARLLSVAVPAVPTVAGVDVRPVVASPSFAKLGATLAAGDVAGGVTTTIVLPESLGPVGPPTAIRLPQSLDGYETNGFLASASGSPKVVQSFADVVELSSPQTLPSAYWAQVASAYVIVVGRMGGAESDPRTKLHFLAIPTSYRLLPTSPSLDGGAGTTVGGDF